MAKRNIRTIDPLALAAPKLAREAKAAEESPARRKQRDRRAIAYRAAKVAG